MNDTPAPNPRRSLPWLAWGLINIVSLPFPVVFSIPIAIAAGGFDGRKRIMALLILSGWALMIISLVLMSSSDGWRRDDGLGVQFMLFFASIGAGIYPVVVAVFFGMGKAADVSKRVHKPDSDLERLVVEILWLAVIFGWLLLPHWFFSSFSLPYSPAVYAAIALGEVAAYFGIKKGLAWATSAPPTQAEKELETILEAIEVGESDVVEFHEGADLEKIGETLAAFANTRGGLLILGIKDDGKVVGVEEDSETLTARMTSFIQNGLSAPVWACRLGDTILPEGRIHWIQVQRQLAGSEPLRCGGTVYVRHGRSNVEPNPLELEALYEKLYIVKERTPLVA